jgi:hypothetical protein
MPCPDVALLQMPEPRPRRKPAAFTAAFAGPRGARRFRVPAAVGEAWLIVRIAGAGIGGL